MNNETTFDNFGDTCNTSQLCIVSREVEQTLKMCRVNCNTASFTFTDDGRVWTGINKRYVYLSHRQLKDLKLDLDSGYVLRLKKGQRYYTSYQLHVINYYTTSDVLDEDTSKKAQQLLTSIMPTVISVNSYVGINALNNQPGARRSAARALKRWTKQHGFPVPKKVVYVNDYGGIDFEF
jgi:hypothetical protein